MAIITSPANYAKLDYYRNISRQLSVAEGLTEERARALARDGKSVVWIDGGLHASEVLGAQQLLETVYQMVSHGRGDAVPQRRHPPGDARQPGRHGPGVGSAYLRRHRNAGTSPTTPGTTTTATPTNALAETTNVSVIREWFRSHTPSPDGSAGRGDVRAAVRDPFNYNYEIPAAIDPIGSIVATRFIEKEAGVASRRASAIHVVERRVRTVATPQPDRHSHGDDRQPTPTSTVQSAVGIGDSNVVANSSAGHSVSRSLFDHGQPRGDGLRVAVRETLLYRIYQMGRDNIKWGSEDRRTFTPHKSARSSWRRAARGCSRRGATARTGGTRPCCRRRGGRCGGDAAAGARSSTRR